MLIGKMNAQECGEFLARLAFGRLGCARSNQPYIVPIYFVYEPGHLYGFATLGQKIEWMRSNPLVCVQTDEILNRDSWASVVVSGRYEELRDTPQYARERAQAQALLEKRSLWWQTGYVASQFRNQPGAVEPVFYCIHVDEMTGLRASPEGSPVRVR